MNENTLVLIVMAVVGMVLSSAVHEWAHAMAAFKLGDDTAARQGRLTLNPESHIDPLGTLLMPVIGVLAGGFIIGWAKPVPYSPRKFNRSVSMRTGELLVAAAGPASNLVLAVVCAGLIKGISVATGGQIWEQGGPVVALGTFLVTAIWLNVLLAVFNLVPIVPLDGSKVLASILGPRHTVVQFMEQYQLMLFIALIAVGGRIIVRPMLFLFSGVVDLFGIGHEVHLLWSLM